MHKKTLKLGSLIFLIVILCSILISACILDFTYFILFLFGYVFFIFMLINAFYFKKDSGVGFVSLVGLLSLTCFVPFIVIWNLFLSDSSLGKFLASVCVILLLGNASYILLQIFRKETKLHLISYTTFLFIVLTTFSLAYEYLCYLMNSQGT